MIKRALDFSFINQDVQTQLAQSREILSVVRSLQAALDAMPKEDATRNKLEETARRLLGIANTLTNNANSTSNTAALTITSSST